MASIVDVTISGYNEYMDSFRQKGKEVRFCLTKFSSDRVDVSDIKAVKDAVKLTRNNYHPDGGTPLYDAVGGAIKHVEGQIGDGEAVINGDYHRWGRKCIPQI